MARQDSFSGLTEFLAVANLGSFRAASAELRVTPAAVSLAIKSLESRLGMPLFLRTTRSVSLTEAGASLLARLRPAATDIGEALEEVGAMRRQPTGQLRLTVPRIALDLIVYPVLPEFRKAFTDIKVELDVRDDSVDLGASGIDAGIRIGQFIERDMVAVRLTSDFQWCVLGAPSYFALRGRPTVPKDLVEHECIGYRFPSAKNLYRWQFRMRGRDLSVDVPGHVIVNDHLTMIALAKAGVGLTFTAQTIAREHLADGTLESVLDAYCIKTPGLFLYFPAKSQRQPKLRAFIDFAKRHLRQVHG